MKAEALIGGALLAGLGVGVGSVAISPGGMATLKAAVTSAAVSHGIARARPPQAGDYWSGCNSAREAGTAPIYRGEPGYREGMDGDGDGIACEPYR